MYYMITWGLTQVEEAYVGTDPEDVIERARPLINKWPEYKHLETEELLELLLSDECEFDMVQIQCEWQGYELSKDVISDLYENHSLPPKLYATQI